MKKKVLAGLLTAAMAATMLVGCGGKDAATDAPATDDAATTDDAAADDGAADDAAEGDSAASGNLIKVGIINNDPNE